jgi:hypothetical protein
MRQLAFHAVLVVSHSTFALACGGAVTAQDAGADTGSPVDSGFESGNDSGCPRPPAAPIYACDAAAPDAQTCGPWGSTASSPRYPEGCVVTTTMEGTYCGPVTCNCMTELTDGAAEWICPL